MDIIESISEVLERRRKNSRDIERNPEEIGNIDPNIYSEEEFEMLCYIAVKENGNALRKVPREYITKDLCIEALKSLKNSVSDKEIVSFAKDVVPNNYQDEVLKVLGIEEKNFQKEKSLKEELERLQSNPKLISDFDVSKQYFFSLLFLIKGGTRSHEILKYIDQSLKENFGFIKNCVITKPLSLEYLQVNRLSFEEKKVIFCNALKKDWSAIFGFPVEGFLDELFHDKDLRVIYKLATGKADFNKEYKNVNLLDDMIYDTYLALIEQCIDNNTFNKYSKNIDVNNDTEAKKKIKKIREKCESLKGNFYREMKSAYPLEISLQNDKDLWECKEKLKQAREEQVRNKNEISSGEVKVENQKNVKNESKPKKDIVEKVEEITETEKVIEKNEVVKEVETETIGKNNTNERLRKKFDVNNENDMNKLFKFYAQMNVAYYNKKDRTAEEVKLRRNINAQFKRIIDKKANALFDEEKSEDSNFEQKIQEINNGTLFPENEIDEIAKSKGATIKLFQIFASGVYEKDGARTRLTQKQRCALASVLQKVSEKKLDIESVKLGEKGKKSKINESLVKVSESEKGE